jgi:hypothetical protein
MNRKTLAASMITLFVVVLAILMADRSGRWAVAQEGASGSESSAEGGAAPTAPDYPPEPDAPEEVVSWRVVGSALKPRENDVNYITPGHGGCVYVSAGDISTVWNIPVHLPQGALVDSLRMYFYDSTLGESLAYLTAYDFNGNIAQEWSVKSVGTSGYGFNDTGLINHTIDYSFYSYVLNWKPNNAGSSMQLCGVRIFYTAPMFGAGFVPVIHNENP